MNRQEGGEQHNMESHTFDILYEGFAEWQRKVKGYQACPDKEAIRQWESWKAEIVNRMKVYAEETKKE